MWPWRAARLGAAALALAAWVLAACGASQPAPTTTPAGPAPTDAPEVLQAELAALPSGDAAAGKAVFSAAGCVACHSLEPGVRIVGPSHAGVATRAAARKAGYSAQLYIYESITRPNAYVVDGFPSGIMPQDFKQRLKPQELADVIAFLMTEK
jgi:cytochrome c551/c552